ncbi:transposase [Streptomyces pratens]|uniref:Transposase n=1 Tax=Streptomyces pratens TaxID=887456 RepID=A0ABW1M6E5_9ACTN
MGALTCVVDHDSGRVVWMAEAYGKTVLDRFFDDLGLDRAARLTHISADGVGWIAEVTARRAPDVIRVMDPFHVVAWATEALDAERRASWNRVRREVGGRERARALQDSRFALWKNAGDLTDRQAAELAWIAAKELTRVRAHPCPSALCGPLPRVRRGPARPRPYGAAHSARIGGRTAQAYRAASHVPNRRPLPPPGAAARR